MDIAAIGVFVQVMQARSFTEVARARRIAPSSVSRASAQLEQELGVRLFNRTTRRLEPTEAGRLYYERVGALIDELEQAQAVALDAGSRPAGELRVSAPVVFTERVLAPHMPRFAARYPELRLDLAITDAFVDLVGDRVDVAIRLGVLEDSTLVARRLRPLRFHVCASPDYLEARGAPARPADLARHEALLFPRQGRLGSWRFRRPRGRVSEVRVQGRLLMTNSEAIRQCAVAGSGIALLPDWLVGRDLADGRLVALLEDYDATPTSFDAAIWAVYPSRDYQPEKARVFLDYLAEHL